MEQEDLSNLLQKMSQMMHQSVQNDSPSSNDMSFSANETQSRPLQDLLSTLTSTDNQHENTENNFQFDFETILAIKKMMDAFYASQKSPEANLLLSLKPYLNQNRKQKLDQYIQFLNISKMIELWNMTNGGEKK